MSSTNVTLLDCTLRDGGYYNDWDFSTDLIEDYLGAMEFAGVPWVELGFRRLPKQQYLGPTAYTTDRFIDGLNVPDTLNLGVMVDAKELQSSGQPADVVDRLFAPAATSRIQLVRIAAHYRELEGLRPAVYQLQELGYDVGLNLMQISERTDDEIQRFAGLASDWQLTVAYFADSFGGLQPDDVTHIIDTITPVYTGPLGCHMHDNMGMALANSKAAIGSGATWTDGTLLGMGRGPGNARTEYLAIDLTRSRLTDINHMPLLALVASDFARLQQRYAWGSNIYYFLSAAYGVHPSYVHEMTKDGRYDIDEIVTALTQLEGGAGHAFSVERMSAATIPDVSGPSTGSYDAQGWCADKDLLIVGQGPQGTQKRREVEQFIRDVEPVVVALNVEPPVDPGLVSAYVLCHPVRALIDADAIAKLNHPVFCPSQIQHLITVPEHTDMRDFGVTVNAGTFEVHPSGCTIPRLEAAAYALAVARAGGARRILLAGFDGFDPLDDRQVAMCDVFERFAAAAPDLDVVALTPTTYPVRQSSLFAELV
jgi:4-hydroxy 2-oxovalerate aldolase